MSGDLAGRNAIITGGSQGLGFEIAKAYVSSGANVIVCGRDRHALDAAVASLEGLCEPGQVAGGIVADVSRIDEVRALVGNAVETMGGLQVLVNNAGVYGPIGPVEENDWEAWRKAVEINLFGPVMMCREVMPYFKRAKYGKIIQLSGGGATSPLPRFSSYAASKAGVIRFVETLAVEAAEFNIDVNAIAPGALNTRLLDEVLAAGAEKAGQEFFVKSVKQQKDGGADMRIGAELAVYLASSRSDGISGRLISAIWDDWRSLAEHRREIGGSDVYTLRRIIPSERGFDWGEVK